MHKTSVILSLVIFGVFLATVPNSGFAYQTADDIVNEKVVKLKSEILNEERRLFIHLPDDYARSNQRYPVLYVYVHEPSSFHFPTVVVQHLSGIGLISKMIIVGLGDIDIGRDLTPTHSDVYGPNSGDAENFIKHIKEEIIPHVDENFRTQPCRIFQGHSILGTFGVYAFLSEPDLFQAYILSSPWFIYDLNERYLLNHTKTFLGQRQTQINFLYLTVGDEPRLKPCIEEFVQILEEQKIDNLEWLYIFQNEENHETITANVLIDGLRAIYSQWKEKPVGFGIAQDIINAAKEDDLTYIKMMLGKNQNRVNDGDNRHCTPLHYASNGGLIDMAKLLIEKGANLESKDADGDTPLHWAAYAGRKNVAELLLAQGANIKAKNHNGQTPFDYAVTRRQNEMIFFFLTRCAEVELHEDQGRRLLHLATSGSHTELMDLLITKGVDINSKNDKDGTLLHSASSGGLREWVEKMIKNGADINSRDGNGDTSLHYAARGGQKDLVEYFINNNVDVNIEDNHGRIPLHYAIEEGHIDVMEYLLLKGADIRAQDQWGFSTLHYTAFRGQKDIFNLLYGKGLDINTKNTNGGMTIHLAAQTGQIDIMKALVELGADVDVSDGFGLTPLNWAAVSGRRDIVDLIMPAMKNRKFTDQFKRTPLHLASYHGQQELVAYLIEKNIHIDAKDADGRTALHWAVHGGQKGITEFLVEKGAEVDSKDKRERTPLHLGAIKGNQEIINLLIHKVASIDGYDKDGNTPLNLAQSYGRQQSAVFLSDGGAKSNDSKNGLSPTTLLKKNLAEGEAIIWYTGHCGWVLKTKNHLLIFDYIGRGRLSEESSLANGFINPAEIKDQKVTVFVTHQHGDHFDRVVLEWEKSIGNITYVFGWKPFDNPDYHYFTEPGTERTIGDVQIATVYSHHSDVPEAAYLVKVDGIVIYHSGDYVGNLNSYKDDIDYLSTKHDQVDIVFSFLVGTTPLYTIEKLAPKVAFPMHAFGREYMYKRSASNFSRANSKTKVVYTENRGDRLFYSKGKIKK